MREHIRYDQGELKVIETGEGFLKAEATIARPGVFSYATETGESRQAKLPDEILSPATVESAKGVPITDTHPKVDGLPVFVTPENYKDFSEGNFSEPRVENGLLKGLITIYDSALIEDVKAGKKELSIGFACDEDNTPGVYQGQAFDTAQRNIRINHVAIVDVGRAGPSVRIHIDKGDHMSKENKSAAGAGASTPDGKTFSYRLFDGSTDIQVSKDAHSELTFLRKKVKADEDALENLQNQLASVQATVTDPGGEAEKADLLNQINDLNKKIDDWKSKYSDLEKSVPDQVEEGAKDLSEAKSVANDVDPTMQTDGFTALEIKKQVIAKILPFANGIKVDSLSKSEIEARFDAARELHKAKGNQRRPNAGNDRTPVVDEAMVAERKNNLANWHQIKKQQGAGTK